MQAVEFITELRGESVLPIAEDVAARLPKTGSARVIVVTGEQPEDIEWRRAAYEQFMRDDPPEDAVYDDYR